jgi:hypothetical protein
MRRINRLIAYSLLAVLLVLLLVLYALYLSAQRPPKFYRDNLDVAFDIQETRNREMLRKARLLNNDIQKTNAPWEGSFSNDEINGYLAVEVGKESSNLFPKEVKEPRLTVRDHRLDFACRLEEGQVTGILHLAIDAMIMEPNRLMFRLKHVSLGRLPIAKERPKQLILDALRKQGYAVTEGTMDGDPTFTISLELSYGKDKAISLESIELLDGGLRISGTTTKLPKSEPGPAVPLPEPQ